MFGAIVLNDALLNVGRFRVVENATLIADFSNAVHVAARCERFARQRIDGARVGFGGAQFLHHNFPIVVSAEKIAILVDDVERIHAFGVVFARQIGRPRLPRHGFERIEKAIVETDVALCRIGRNANAQLRAKIYATIFRTDLMIDNATRFVARQFLGADGALKTGASLTLGRVRVAFTGLFFETYVGRIRRNRRHYLSLR